MKSAVNINMIVQNPEGLGFSAVGLILDADRPTICYGATPGTPAHKWMSSPEADANLRELGIRRATLTEYNKLMATAQVFAERDEPMDLLDSKHMPR